MKTGYIVRYRRNAEIEEKIKSMGNITVVKNKMKDKKIVHIILEKNSYLCLKGKEICNTGWIVRYLTLLPVITEEGIKKHILIKELFKKKRD